MKRTNDIALNLEEAQSVSCVSAVYDQLREALFSPEWIERFRLSETAFTRARDLPFAPLVTWLLNLRQGSLEQELEGLFATLERQPYASATPTPSALCQAHQRLSAQVFAALNRLAIATWRGTQGPTLWHGFRLLAVDGSTLRLPRYRGLEAYFGAQASGPLLARVSMRYELGPELILDFQQGAYCISERELAIAPLQAAEAGDLILYDRGYPAFWLMAMHQPQGLEFCMRLSRASLAAAEAFWTSEATSEIITLNPSCEQRRECRQQGLSTDPIRLRLVRVRLQGGETEVLATTVLEAERLPARLFQALYHRRWGRRRATNARLAVKLSAAVEAIRPDRQFLRKNPGKLKPGFHAPYRRTA